MPRFASILLAVVLVAVAAFCVFGFLATYEPPGAPVLRVIYAAVGLLSLVGVGVLVFRSRGGPSRGFPIEPRPPKGEA
jgi:hypothetical protein